MAAEGKPVMAAEGETVMDAEEPVMAVEEPVMTVDAEPDAWVGPEGLAVMAAAVAAEPDAWVGPEGLAVMAAAVAAELDAWVGPEGLAVMPAEAEPVMAMLAEGRELGWPTSAPAERVPGRPTLSPGEPLLAVREPMLAPEEEEEEGEAEADWKWNCIVRDCACFWSRCSPRIPRVGPGRDYVCIPAGADHRPTWSLLLGVREGTVLRLKRLRIARSGRILGRSEEALEAFHDIAMPRTKRGSAALAPDGRSLCVLLQQASMDKSQALQLNLHLPPQTKAQEPAATTSELLHLLPEVEVPGRSIPISFAGDTWALTITMEPAKFSVAMARLVPGPQHRWQQVGQAFKSPHERDMSSQWAGGFLQGYAVLPEINLVLVSFKQDGLFLTFAPGSGEWSPVLVDTTRLKDYVPIPGRGVYLEQDKAVYMLRHNTIYAYKLAAYRWDDDGQLRLDPPVTVGSVCPFNSTIGYGLLTRLDNARLMCSVWISLAWPYCEPCTCGNLHAIITTFHLRDQAQGGIEVLHSTFRRVHMLPNPKNQEFCFLQEYEDKDTSVLLQHQPHEDLTSSQHVDEPFKMHCCRLHFSVETRPRMCFLCGGEGHYAPDCSLTPQEPSSAMPPWGPSRSMQVDPASMQYQVSFSSRPVAPLKPATTTIKKDLFIICQAGSQPVFYHTGIMGESLLLARDSGKLLQQCYVADDGDDYWHFFHSGSKLHAVSSERDGMLEFCLSKDGTTMDRRPVRRPKADPFVVVIRVGGETIAITYTLQVFHQTGFTSTTWMRIVADDSHVLCRKVVISGYVAVNDHSFLVFDAVTCSCLFFDLGVKKWRVVMPWAAFTEELPRPDPRVCVLNGRCVVVDGFIYTCIDGGLAAYQLLDKDHSMYLSTSIFLPFSWDIDCVGEDMCLDYAGQDVSSGAIFFYVVQGGYSPPKQDVHIAIVKVKTGRRGSSNKRKPVRVELVDRFTRFIWHKEAVDTRCCFAVSCV